MTQVKKIAVTDANASITFSPVVYLVTLKNVGVNSCYFNLNGVATTSHFKLYPMDELTIGLSTITTVQAICDTGLTTTLDIIGSSVF